MPTAIGTYATLADVKTRMGRTDTADDTLIQQLCDETNQWIETYTGRVIAPYSATTYTLDGNTAVDTFLDVPIGIRTLTLVEVAPYTGSAFTTVPATDYLIRPDLASLPPGWPATTLLFSDYPAGSYAKWPAGYANVRLTGTFGFAAIPDDVRGVAIARVVRQFHGRQAGQTDIIGSDETGAPIVSRYTSPADLATLNRYRRHQVVFA